MPIFRSILLAVVPVALLVTACSDDDSDPADAQSVAFAEPADGDRVAGAVHLVMTADGVTIEEAGEVHDDAGHFHVIADDGCVATGESVPKDVDHVHFGKGQSEGAIYLGPGPHELCLQVGDGVHEALAITDQVSIDVGVEDRDEWCAVTEQVDERFSALDGDGEEFAVRKEGYAGVVRLIDQLVDGIDTVDAATRDAVLVAITNAQKIAAAFADAADEAGAEQALLAVFGTEGVRDDDPGTQWIGTTCKVDMGG